MTPYIEGHLWGWFASDQVIAELDACLHTIRAQSEEIKALDTQLGIAVKLLEVATQQIQELRASAVKRGRGRPSKMTAERRATLLASFEMMSADFKKAKPRAEGFTDLDVLKWWFNREWDRSGKEPRGGRLLWADRKLKTFRNRLSEARHSNPVK